MPDTFLRKASNTGGTLLETLRQNPVPLVLIGTGLGVLLAGRLTRSRTPQWDRQQQYLPFTPRYRPIEPTLTGRARDTVSELAESAKDKIQTAGASLRESAGQLGVQARQSYDEAGQRFQDLLKENPLAVGAAALAAGALIGLLIPRSEVEDEYFGEAREQFLEKAQQATKYALQKIPSTMEELARRNSR